MFNITKFNEIKELLNKTTKNCEIIAISKNHPVESVEEAINQKDSSKAKDLFASAQKALDKLANKKVLPKNKVARQKSRLSNSIKKLG